jgi:ferrous iron transport protein B
MNQIDRTGVDHVVALAGNPNTGKSTVFNALTGLRQHTGNWPGKTVSRAEGDYLHEGRRYRLIDLPGTYSLLSASVDEEIARDFILFGRPDCTIVVLDATSLERNLNLALQVIEITSRVVVCLNLMDEAQRRGISVDHEGLSAELGVPVVPTIARYGRGLKELTAAVARIVSGETVTTPRRLKITGDLEEALEELVPMIEDLHHDLPNARWVALRLLDGDYAVRQAVLDGHLGELAGEER